MEEHLWKWALPEQHLVDGMQHKSQRRWESTKFKKKELRKTGKEIVPVVSQTASLILKPKYMT